MSVALSDSGGDISNRSGSSTHHSASPLNTIIPNEAELTIGGDGLILESVNFPLFEHSLVLNTLILLMRMHIIRGMRRLTHMPLGLPVGSALLPVVHIVKPSLGVILIGAALVCSSLRGDMDLPAPFVLAWSLATYFILNDVESCRDMMINLATPAVRDQQNRLSDYQALQHLWFELGRRALAQIDILWWYEALIKDCEELYESHRSCQGVSDRKKADLTEKLAAMEKEKDDLMEKDREREERIKQLEADLASKTSFLTEAEGAISTLKGDLERLTWLLSSDEYKKSLSDVFNLAFAAGWSEGVKATCSKEEAKAFLAIAADYDPACKPTFMSEFDSFFNKSYPCGEAG
ncbi:hypothetical protein Tco_0752668 [Tanacetum coccineum]|uniref:Uncharacterized protein n=1 Tax=Tanacetum coccineum TaxID=301880 RepID=A0ABQ4ZAV5_9ASTR